MQPNVDHTVRPSVRLAVVLLLTAVGAGLAGAGLTLLLHAVQHAAYGYDEGRFLAGVEQASSVRRVVVLTLAGLVGGLGFWAVRRFCGPLVATSDAVWNRGGDLPPVRAVLNGLVQVVVVGLGASLGREQAPKEAAAAIGSELARLTGLTVADRRLVVACGAGAGMAAVYDVPLGGALFTAEVLLGTLALPSLTAALAVSVIAAVVAWIEVPDAPQYVVGRLDDSAAALGLALLVGIAAGVVGAALVRLLRWSKTWKPSGWRVVPVATVALALLGLTAVIRPELLGNGRGPAQLAFEASASVPLLLLLVVAKPLATALCLRSGLSGGLFTPVLATGAVLGGALGHLGGNPGSIAVLGAAAMLAVAFQAPLSSAVLVLELTGVGQTAIVPLVLAVGVATGVGRLLGVRSLYEA